MDERIERLARESADVEAWSGEVSARDEAWRIIASVENEAAAVIERAERTAEKWLAAERAKRLGEAHGRILESSLTIKHRAVERATTRARETLTELRDNPQQYEPVLEKLILEATRGIENPLVEVAPRDVEMAEEILRKNGIKGEVRPSSSVDAGAVVRDTTRGFSVYNTFSERLRKAAELLLSRFGEVFGTE
ncbi:MAG: V-type ATP synthase subunit E family protein [candidate division WOR-3 bacterium]